MVRARSGCCPSDDGERDLSDGDEDRFGAPDEIAVLLDADGLDVGVDGRVAEGARDLDEVQVEAGPKDHQVALGQLIGETRGHAQGSCNFGQACLRRCTYVVQYYRWLIS